MNPDVAVIAECAMIVLLSVLVHLLSRELRRERAKVSDLRVQYREVNRAFYEESARLAEAEAKLLTRDPRGRFIKKETQ